MKENNIAGNIFTLIIMMYIISVGLKIATLGWQTFRYQGFRRFKNNGSDFMGESNNKRWKKASKAFGVSVRKLKKMSKDEIKKLYRKMAMKHHPDTGGDPDKFRDLHEAYEFAYAA